MKFYLTTLFTAALLIPGGAVLAQVNNREAHRQMSVSNPEADNSVEAERGSFTLDDGFEVNLFADESDGIANPVCMSWDSAGRLWVLCTLAYPQLVPVDYPNDQLLILEDTDGDGRADKTTIFADGLNMPTGFAIGHGGAYIAEGNDLLHVKDTNGDGEADTRRVVLTGFGTGDTHQNINSLTWSPGGELLFSQGLHTFSRVETPWGISRLDEHGTWRLRPRRLQLHPFPRTGGSNPWGINFGNWGEPFSKSNGSDVFDLLPGLVSRETSSGRIGGETSIGKTLIKSMIIEFAESPHLPDDIQGEMLIAGYFARDINRFQWEPDGAGHRLKLQPNLLTSSHRAFRPVDIRIGPDGAIYIADWFNPIIGHYQASFRHPDRDMTHGRIWRITAKGSPLANAPDFSEMTASALCRQLESDWRYERYQAKRQLADMPVEEVLPDLTEWVEALDENDPNLEHRLYEAIGVFESHEAVNRPLLERLLNAKDYRARAYATRVVGRWSDRIEAPLELLDRSVNDESTRVRLEAVVACSDLRNAESIVVAAKATNRKTDRFIEFALTQTVHALASDWLPALENNTLHFARPENLSFVLRAFGGKEVLAQVRRLLEKPALDTASVNRLMALLVETGTAQDQRWVLDHAEDKPAVLDAFVDDFTLRGLVPTGDLVAPLRRILGSDQLEIRERAIQLAGVWKVGALADRIRKIVFDPAAPVALRCAAVEAHGRLRGTLGVDDIMAAIDDPSTELRLAALRVLGDLDLSRAAETANQLLREAASEDEVRGLLTPFLRHKKGSATLATALSAEPVRSELAVRIRGVLGSAGRFDPVLDKVLRPTAEKDAVGLPEFSEAYVKALSAEVKQHGDPVKGAKTYATATLSCIACHKVGDAGGVLGPELTAVGSGVPIELLIEAVLWPKRQIKEGYIATNITTKAESVISGYVDTENNQRIIIRDAATGVTQTVPVNQVADRQDAGTLMPPGLTAGLSRADLRDLIRYLSELKGQEGIR
ncbi:MAG: c-type cytochrome [Opitutales bacterium]|nr:c-type cytochrome [Opitutales bacterium]